MVEKLLTSLTLCYQSIKYHTENEKANFLKVLKVIFESKCVYVPKLSKHLNREIKLRRSKCICNLNFYITVNCYADEFEFQINS